MAHCCDSTGLLHLQTHNEVDEQVGVEFETAESAESADLGSVLNILVPTSTGMSIANIFELG